MKKTLLLLVTLSISISSYSQAYQQKTSSPIISAAWTRLSGSMNVLGFLNSNSKILNYNRYINTVSFIQHKSPTYTLVPNLPANAQSGAIVAYLGKNGGTQWDSTLVWADASNWARYPSGGIYSPPGNTVYANAYVVVTGPLTGASSSWVGNYYASKSLTATPKNSAGVDMQTMLDTPPFSSTTSPTTTKHDFPRFSFISTDDGKVRVAGSLYDDVNGTTDQAKNYRGGTISRGSFNSGVFVWTIDSFTPPCVTKTNGIKSLHDECWMTWDAAGTNGAIMFIGARAGSTGSNMGWQPIIYRTTNSGNTWALVNGIDFNQTNVFDKILNSLGPVNSNTNLIVPKFNTFEGIDISSDLNTNKVHIFTTVVGTSSTHNDSLDFVRTYGSNNYHWPFCNNKWAYLIDFTGDGGSPWQYKIIDSCGTQSFSTPTTFTNNYLPWSGLAYPGPGLGVNGTAMRLQMSRTCYGDYMLYSWAESDTLLTTNATKWNEFPNIKMKAQRLCDGTISTDEFMVSSPATGFNLRVRDKAYFHYMCPVSRNNGSTMSSATFTTPFTVSNNTLTDPSLSVDNFYCNVTVQFSFQNGACGSLIPNCTGIGDHLEQITGESSEYKLYPNPTSHDFNASITLEQSSDISIEVFNLLGQKIARFDHKGTVGENTIPVNLQNCKPGIYFVKVKAGNSESTQKLIIE